MKLNVLNNLTCYTTHAQHNVDCNRKSCDHWFKNSQNNNCIIIAASNGPRTMQDVGMMFNVTRMRICQIEHALIAKIKQDDLIQDEIQD